MPFVSKAQLGCDLGKTFIRVGSHDFHWKNGEVYKEVNIGAEYYDYEREILGKADTLEEFQNTVIGYFVILTMAVTNAVNETREVK